MQRPKQYVHTRGWTTSVFLKSTFMWWKWSQSRLVADDVINEHKSGAVTNTLCTAMKYDTALPTWLLLL